MSNINTTGIDTTYPTPGKNNSTQGLRDNFTQIKSQLDVAASELTDLQSKTIVKTALANTTISNDFANTLISNASILGFRSTTYNLGSALSGNVVIDLSKGDVHFGTIVGNVSLSFLNWAPTGTKSDVQLKLTNGGSNLNITLPQSVLTNNDYGAVLLENSSVSSNTALISFPANSSILEYNFSTLDCGNTVTVSPLNRPYKATQVTVRDPSPNGLPGDRTGEVVTGTSLPQFTATQTQTTGNIITTNTSGLYSGLPITFTGIVLGGIVANQTYYINNILNSTTFTVSSTLGGSTVTFTAATGSMKVNPESYMYFCSANYNSTSYSTAISSTNNTGNIVVSSVGSLTVNVPVVFTGNVFGGITSGQTYYVKTVDSGNSIITISQTRNAGIAGNAVVTTTATGSMTATYYIGSDIWKRVKLSNW